MSEIVDLVSLVPPPNYVRAVDWGAVQAALGFALPSDYKAIIDRYGRGSFGEFLWLLQPADSNRFIDLRAQRDTVVPGLEILAARGPESMPYAVQSLIPCAATDNGDTVYWLTDSSADPDRWIVTVGAARDDAWDEFDGTLLEFLVAILSGTYMCPVFPRSFPDPEGSHFTPHP